MCVGASFQSFSKKREKNILQAGPTDSRHGSKCQQKSPQPNCVFPTGMVDFLLFVPGTKEPLQKKDMNNHTSLGHDGDKLICLTVTETFRDVHIPKLEVKMTHGTPLGFL